MQRFCLIGHPVAHSLSPPMHNAAFKDLGIDAAYELWDILPGDLENFMVSYAEKFAGGNVTLPYKSEIMQYLDEIEPAARALGGVNCIVNKNGLLHGYNTDVIGAMQALGNVSGKKVLIVGAGGVAKAVAYGVSKAGAELIVLNRTVEKARELAGRYSGEFGGLEDFEKFEPDVVVNCTSVGMVPDMDVSPLPEKAWEYWQKAPRSQARSALAMDTIFNPPKTTFLKDAEKAGFKVIPGNEMLLYQGVAAFKLWTGKEPSVEVMKATIMT